MRIKFSALKLGRFIEVKLTQPENIQLIVLTNLVFILFRFIEVNEEQPRNIESISVTSDVSKLEK